MGSSPRKVVVTGDIMIDSKIASGHVYERKPERTPTGAGTKSAAGKSENPATPNASTSGAGKPPAGTPGDRNAEEDTPLFGPRVYLHRYDELGGAMLLWGIINAALNEEPVRERVKVSGAGSPILHPRIEAGVKSKIAQSVWQANFVAGQFRRHSAGDDEDIHAVWRIKDRLGIDRQAEGKLGEMAVTEFPLSYPDVDETGDADLVVVDHLKQGFAQQPRLWPKSLREPVKSDARLVVRWVHPQLDRNTKFWTDMQLQFAGRIVVVAAAEHLRLYGMQISRGLSWEKTIHELHDRVSKLWNDALHGCAHLVVSFFPAGAVVFSADVAGYPNPGPDDGPDKVNLRMRLVYDPAQIEGSWADGFNGDMMGTTRCLTAGIALEMMLAEGEPELERGVKAGLLAGRHVLMAGFAATGDQDRKDTALPEYMVFPVKSVGRVLASVLGSPPPKDAASKSPIDAASASRVIESAAPVDSSMPSVAVGTPVGPELEKKLADERTALEALDKWLTKEAESIATQSTTSKEFGPGWRLLDRSSNVRTEGTLAYAADLARYGATHRSFDFPTLRIGKLFITDRVEMETIRNVRDLIVNYMSSPGVSAPLSIAVFGQPGSGKSFAIEQLARDLSDEDKQSRVERIPIEEVTFNVSQFAGLPSLVSALHRVRDIGLAAKIPLVFWDEFDSSFDRKSLGWLRYFLAPMQDGQFLDGFNMHNVGRAIFVFAGGTFNTMADFHAETAAYPVDPKKPGRRYRGSTKDAKLPDFISRLKGFVDVPTLDYRSKKIETSIALRRPSFCGRSCA